MQKKCKWVNCRQNKVRTFVDRWCCTRTKRFRNLWTNFRQNLRGCPTIWRTLRWKDTVPWLLLFHSHPWGGEATRRTSAVFPSRLPQMRSAFGTCAAYVGHVFNSPRAAGLAVFATATCPENEKMIVAASSHVRVACHSRHPQ